MADAVRDRLKAAAEAAPLERESCIRIQRLFRGAFVRETVATTRAACIQLTRAFRGHRVRLAYRAKVDAAAALEGTAVVHYHAVMVQKAYRGYFSRTHYHDYSARKKKINEIRITGEELRARLKVGLAAAAPAL